MADIATYNANEARAIHGVRDWRISRLFRSDTFATLNFLVRIEVVSQIKGLMTALHHGKAVPLQNELRGIDDEVLDELARAMRVVVEMQLSLFPEGDVGFPVEAVLSDYLIARKLLALPRHARILDIGPGCGLLPLFLSRRPEVARYDQIEVTQSLYVLQALVNRTCYGSATLDLAAAGVPVPDVFGKVDEGWKRQPYSLVGFERQVRCTHFPWWHIDSAFEGEYDVIMMNENMCEMPAGAAAYYLQQARKVLAPDGYLLINGIGRTDSQATLDQRLKTIESLGYRIQVSCSAQEHGGPLAAPNLVLVGPEHPRYGDLSTSFFELTFNESDPMVRAMYGLDRPTGPAFELPELTAEIKRRVDRLREVGGRG